MSFRESRATNIGISDPGEILRFSPESAGQRRDASFARRGVHQEPANSPPHASVTSTGSRGDRIQAAALGKSCAPVFSQFIVQ